MNFFSIERQKALVSSAAMSQPVYFTANQTGGTEYHTSKLHRDCYLQLKQTHKHSKQVTLTKLINMQKIYRRSARNELICCFLQGSMRPLLKKDDARGG